MTGSHQNHTCRGVWPSKLYLDWFSFSDLLISLQRLQASIPAASAIRENDKTKKIDSRSVFHSLHCVKSTRPRAALHTIDVIIIYDFSVCFMSFIFFSFQGVLKSQFMLFLFHFLLAFYAAGRYDQTYLICALHSLISI